MLNAGLSPRLKDSTIGKTSAFNAEATFGKAPQIGGTPAGASLKLRSIGKHDLMPAILMSPLSEMQQVGMRNRNSVSMIAENTADAGASALANDNHRKLLMQLQEEKIARK